MAKAAGVNKRLTNLLGPTMYRTTEIMLGSNINPERSPVEYASSG